VKSKSPLKDLPLRRAGQSIQEQQLKIASDKLLWPLMLWVAFFLIAVQEWFRYLNPSEPKPWLFTGLAVLATVYGAFRIFSIRRTLLKLRLARHGEEAVGEFLEHLRKDGYQVFHDIVGKGFNVDHVLIGPAGVFTVETKTRSKPAKGSAEVVFDGENVKVAGHEPDRNPVVQARAQAGWLKSLLTESTGKDFPVFPVIVFPGWFIRTTKRPAKKLWVLEPKALPKYLANEEPKMTEADIRLASFHLSRFIRSEEQRRSTAA